jgi:hypothetical protein
MRARYIYSTTTYLIKKVFFNVSRYKINRIQRNVRSYVVVIFRISQSQRQHEAQIVRKMGDWIIRGILRFRSESRVITGATMSEKQARLLEYNVRRRRVRRALVCR